MVGSFDMTNQDNVLFRTNYFQRKWTWIRRFFAIFILGTGCFLLPIEGNLIFIKYIAASLIIFYFISKPKDDIAVTEKFLLHIKRSVISKFSRIDKYDLSEVISIRCGGIHTDKWELVDFFNGGGNMGGFNNIVEITFKNGESKSLQLPIDRKKLDTVVKLIYEIKGKHNPNIV